MPAPLVEDAGQRLCKSVIVRVFRLFQRKTETGRFNTRTRTRNPPERRAGCTNARTEPLTPTGTQASWLPLPLYQASVPLVIIQLVRSSVSCIQKTLRLFLGGPCGEGGEKRADGVSHANNFVCGGCGMGFQDFHDFFLAVLLDFFSDESRARVLRRRRHTLSR